MKGIDLNKFLDENYLQEDGTLKKEAYAFHELLLVLKQVERQLEEDKKNGIIRRDDVFYTKDGKEITY